MRLTDTQIQQIKKHTFASRLAALLQIALGDQRIDVLIIDSNTPLQPVHKVALSEGVQL